MTGTIARFAGDLTVLKQFAAGPPPAAIEAAGHFPAPCLEWDDGWDWSEVFIPPRPVKKTPQMHSPEEFR